MPTIAIAISNNKGRMAKAATLVCWVLDWMLVIIHYVFNCWLKSFLSVALRNCNLQVAYGV